MPITGSFHSSGRPALSVMTKGTSISLMISISGWISSGLSASSSRLARSENRRVVR